MDKMPIGGTERLAAGGVLCAAAVAAACIFRVPWPVGGAYFHMGETVMLASALLFGRRGGALVGGISSALADLLLGSAMWAPFSLVIHSAECYITGGLSDGLGGLRDALAMLCGISVMAAGYTAAAGFLYGAAFMPVELAGDAAQGLVGALSAYPLSRILLRSFPR
jgi:uncharacterized membrane protein